MQCPKCGNQNPDDAQICASCGCALADTFPPATDSKPKTSKMAIVSVLLAGLAAALTFFVDPALAFTAALLGLITAIGSIAKIRRSKGKLIGKSIAIVAVIFSAVHMALLSYWRIDAPPVPNDYTISDIRSAAPQYNQTYQLLKSLADEDANLASAPAIGLSEQDVNNLGEISRVFKEDDHAKTSAVLMANSESILTAWQNAEKGRDVISQLDTFPETADLMDLDFEAEFPHLRNLRRLLHLYRAYVCLQSCQGNEQIAIRELLRLDSISKKLSLNARCTITKLVCFAWFAVDIQAANFIANNPQTSRQSLEQLTKHFIPLADEHISLRNSFISEYLMCKNVLTKLSKEPKLKYSGFPALKLNSTLRLYKNFCDSWIAVEENRRKIKKLRVWPTLYPDLSVELDADGRFPWYYNLYNPIGSMMVGIVMPALGRVCELRTDLQIRYDLIEIVLNKRLGREVSLKARAYSDEYIIDIDKKIIFSLGLDGEAGTKDDIKLPINPEVLTFAD